MARREAVTFLNHRDQRTELRKMKENQAWVINFVQRNLKPDQINKRYGLVYSEKNCKFYFRFKLTWLAALGRIFTNIDTDQLERFQVQVNLEPFLIFFKLRTTPLVFTSNFSSFWNILHFTNF